MGKSSWAPFDRSEEASSVPSQSVHRWLRPPATAVMLQFFFQGGRQLQFRNGLVRRQEATGTACAWASFRLFPWDFSDLPGRGVSPSRRADVKHPVECSTPSPVSVGLLLPSRYRIRWALEMPTLSGLTCTGSLAHLPMLRLGRYRPLRKAGSWVGRFFHLVSAGFSPAGATLCGFRSLSHRLVLHIPLCLVARDIRSPHCPTIHFFVGNRLTIHAW